MDIIKYLELHPQLNTLFSVFVGGISTLLGVCWQQKLNRKTKNLEFIENTRIAYEVLIEEIKKIHKLIDECLRGYNNFIEFHIDTEKLQKFEEEEEFYSCATSDKELEELKKMGQTLKELRDKMRSNNKKFLEQNKKRVNENLSVTQRPGNYLHSYILLALPSEKLNLFRVQIELNNIIDKLNKILVRDHLNLTEYLNADYENIFNKKIEALKTEASEKYKIFLSTKVSE